MYRLTGLKRNLMFKEFLAISEATCQRSLKPLLKLMNVTMLAYLVAAEIQAIGRDKKLMSQRKV
jgi:hypothetical protein